MIPPRVYKEIEFEREFSIFVTVTALTTNCLDVAENVKVLSRVESSPDAERSTSVLVCPQLSNYKNADENLPSL